MPHARSTRLSFAVVVALITTLFAVSPFVLPTHVLAAPHSANLASDVDPFTGTGVQQGHHMVGATLSPALMSRSVCFS
jgi:hypothetical protein